MRLVLATGLLLATLAAGGSDGMKRLPTDWGIAKADGPVAIVGNFPQGISLSPDGTRAAIVENGTPGALVRIIDARTLRTQRTISERGAFGRASWDLDGRGFWVGTADQNAVVHHAVATGEQDRAIALGENFWPAAIARSPDGTKLAVSGESANSVAVVDLKDGTLERFAVGRHPHDVAWSSGSELFVANWGERSLSIVDTTRKTTTSLAVGYHPEALAISRDRATLFVADTDDDTLEAIDTRTKRRGLPVDIGLYGRAFVGASPSALRLSNDGRRLYAACSAANAIAIFEVRGRALRALGAIPAGWYPTDVALDERANAMLILNAKGEGGHPNPQFDPFASRSLSYVASLLTGSVRRQEIPADRVLRSEAARVIRNGAPYLEAAIRDPHVRTYGPASGEDGRRVVRAGGPIRHVVYVIKENRTYDQVLGDVPGADGDPSLTLFGAAITPNQHAIAARFGVFDRVFANAQVSADGHPWSMSAFSNDYIEKMWPPLYGNRRKTYDFEDGADAALPHGGYLWDAAAKAGLSYRDYGEFTTNPAQRGGETTTQHRNLQGHIDPHYPHFELTISDPERFEEWRKEFDGFERAGTFPALEFVQFPTDHTSGTRPGALKPEAMVAGNDFAVGKLVETISHSRYWKDTAIFIIEDDAQNGPDHVDDQRTTFYLISPYARGGVRHERYSTASVVRTIELILGLPPLSPYDAGARPMYAAFASRADLRPFDARPETVDLSAKNTAAAYRASDSARLAFDRPDEGADADLNDILWHAIRGANVAVPPYGVFRRSAASAPLPAALRH